MIRDLTHLLGIASNFVFVFSKVEWDIPLQKYRAWVTHLRAPWGFLEAIIRRDFATYVYFMRAFMEEVSMFTHKRHIMRIITTFRTLVQPENGVIMGYLFFMVGKISVGGNSRTRTMGCNRGFNSYSCLYLNHIGSWGIINTHTGCLGFSFQLFY